MAFYECLSDSCERQLWSKLPAIVFVAIIIVFSLPIPLPRFLSNFFAIIKSPFLPTLTLDEAEELQRQFNETNTSPSQSENRTVQKVIEKAPKWRTGLFWFLAFIEVGGWLVVAILKTIHATRLSTSDIRLYLPFLAAATWVYALVRVIHTPPLTPPFDLFILTIFHLLGRVLTLGGQLYTNQTIGTKLPSKNILVAEGVDLGIITIFLTLIMFLPLNVPSADVDPAKIVSLIV